MRKLKLLGLVIALFAFAADSAYAYKQTPVPRKHTSRAIGDPFWDASVPLNWGKEGSVGDTVWIRVRDDSSCSYTGNILYGGRGNAMPSWAVWCFDASVAAVPGPYFADSCKTTARYGGGLPGCWTHYDAHVFGQTNKWHIDTYDVYLPGSEDSSMWCGELGDTLSWEWPPGYGPGYNFSVLLDLGPSASFSTATGMTLGGFHIFSLELAYDYCFVEMAASDIADTATWREIGRFNGISNPDSVNCRGLGIPGGPGPGSYWGVTQGSGIGNGPYPYLCADWDVFEIKVDTLALQSLGQNGTEKLFVRWRVNGDFLWDDVTGGGTQSDTRGAWRLDHVYAKGAQSPSSHYFPAAGSGARDPSVASGNVDWETLAEDGRSSFSTALLPRAEAVGGYWNGAASAWIHGKGKIVDLWHLTNTPNYINQGNTCETANKWIWAANLNPSGVDDNITDNGFLHRLASPVIDLTPTSPYTAGTALAGNRVSGALVMYDDYLCIKELVSEDVIAWTGRVYVGAPQSSWNQWEYEAINIGGCQAWALNDFSDWSFLLNAKTDSIQTGYDLFDQCNYNAAVAQPCMPGVIIPNPHRKNTFLLDNLAVGLFKQEATIWGVANFQDTFARDTHMHPPAKDNTELFAGDIRQDEDSLAVTVLDFNGIADSSSATESVMLHYRISTNCGTTWGHESTRLQGSKAKPTIEWLTKKLRFSEPDEDAVPSTSTEYNGTYRTVIELSDVPPGVLVGGLWQEGTVFEYYFTVTDKSIPAVRDTVPNRHSDRRVTIHPLYGTERQFPWPYEVTVLPCLPASAYTAQGGKRLLLANEWYNRTSYDVESDQTLAGISINAFPLLSQEFEESLRDLNLKFDRYDNIFAQVSRGTNLGFHTEPADKDGYGGIRNIPAGTHRYEDVIWATGRHNQYTVLDSSQVEVGLYLISNANEGNIWLAGQNVCEDPKMSSQASAYAGGDFWVNYVGAALLTTGCPQNSGLVDKKFYIEGVNNALFTAIKFDGGWADCPIRNQPDDAMVTGTGAGTETVIFQFDNLAHTLNKTAGIHNVQLVDPSGANNEMITTMFDHGLMTTRAARACLTKAILTEFGMTMPAGSKYTAAVCSNSATGVPTGATRRFELAQNHPNPFNPTTKVRYSLPRDGMKVSLTVFDVSGREVVKLVDRIEGGAEHEVFWNGKNSRGESVSSGVYFYRLNADDLSATKKMVLLK